MIDRATSGAPVSARAESKKPVTMHVSEIRIKPMDNGHLVEIRHKPDGKDDYMSETKAEHVFTDADEMMSHISKHVGGGHKEKKESGRVERTEHGITGRKG